MRFDSQAQESVEVAADSGVLIQDLTRWRTCWGAGGRELRPKSGDPELDVGLIPGVSCQWSVVSCRELLTATDGDGRGLGVGQTTRSVGALPHRALERGGSRILPPRGRDFPHAPAAAAGLR